MAYMNQEKKAVIAAALKKVMPKDWKYSLRCARYDITCTIHQAPVDLIQLNFEERDRGRTYLQLNPYHLRITYKSSDVADTLEAVRAALNTGNWDRSDVMTAMTDYFDVGHYINIHVGEWNKPFICTAASWGANTMAQATFYRGSDFVNKRREFDGITVLCVDGATPCDIWYRKYTANYRDVAERKFFVTATLEAAAKAAAKAQWQPLFLPPVFAPVFAPCFCPLFLPPVFAPCFYPGFSLRK